MEETPQSFAATEKSKPTDTPAATTETAMDEEHSPVNSNEQETLPSKEEEESRALDVDKQQTAT